MPDQKHQRRSAEEWQAIINHFKNSGLSGASFCRQQDISYESFCKWRQRLLGASRKSSRKEAAPKPSDFLDLSQLASSKNNWRITLKLGNGVELELNQH